MDEADRILNMDFETEVNNQKLTAVQDARTETLWCHFPISALQVERFSNGFLRC